jgi:hypothetical protein
VVQIDTTAKMQAVRKAKSHGAQAAETPHKWVSSLALQMHTMPFKQAPIGAPAWGRR